MTAEPIVVNEIDGLTLTVVLSRRLRARVWLALLLMKLAAWLMGATFAVEQGPGRNLWEPE